MKLYRFLYAVAGLVLSLLATPAMGESYRPNIISLATDDYSNCKPGVLYTVDDATSASDCSTGGGSTFNVCLCSAPGTLVDEDSGVFTNIDTDYGAETVTSAWSLTNVTLDNQTTFDALTSTETTDTVIDQNTLTGGDKTSANGRWHAWQFSSGSNTDAGTIVVSLKQSSVNSDNNSYVQCEIYDNNSTPDPDEPGSALSADWDHTDTKVHLADVAATYADYELIAPYTLTASELYWVVCKTTMTSGTVNYEYGIPGGELYAEDDDEGASWTVSTNQALTAKVLLRHDHIVEPTTAHSGGVVSRSDNWLAGRFESNRGMALYGTSTEGFGVGGYSKWLAGIRGTSLNGWGLEGRSVNGSGLLAVTDSASANIADFWYWNGSTFDVRANIDDVGLISTAVGIDGIGAVDLDYGSADITDHTFLTDGTGDGEIVMPNDSIGDAEVLDTITASSYLPLAGGVCTGEVTVDDLGLEFTPGDTLTDCSTFAATGGGIFYDDSEGKFKKCQDNTLTDLDTGGSGGDEVLIDGTGVADASGVDLQGGAGIAITFNAGASPDTASFATASGEADFLTLSAAPAADEALTIDTDGDGANLTTDTLEYQSGAEDFMVPGIREYPTVNQSCPIYNSTNNDLEWSSASCTAGGSGDSVAIDGVAATDPDFTSDGDLDAIRCTGSGTPDASCVSAEDVLYRLEAAYKTEQWTWIVKNPSASDDDGNLQKHTAVALTLKRVYCNSSTAGQTCTVNLYDRAESTPNTGTTDLLSADLVCDSDGQATTSFADATIAADRIIALHIAAETVTTKEFCRVSVEAEID